MTERNTVQPITPPEPTTRPTLPPDTRAPVGYSHPTNAWDVARDVAGAGDRAWTDHRRRTRDREPRPPASALAVGTAYAVGALAIIIGVLVIVHQLGAGGYEERQRLRHKAIMVELAAQRTALYQLIDTVAEHHPEAARVGRQLERGSVGP